MTQTVEIDSAIQEMPDKLKKMSAITEPFVIPKRYMTGDEFERSVKERITIFYKEQGLI
jgi:hypothetical protein